MKVDRLKVDRLKEKTPACAAAAGRLAGEGVYLPGSSPGQAPIFRISPPEAGKPYPVLAVPLGWFIGLQDARDQNSNSWL